MPLEPHEKAQLALHWCCARTLDVTLSRSSNRSELRQLSLVRDNLQNLAKSAWDVVNDLKSLEQFLLKAIHQIDSHYNNHDIGGISDQLRSARDLLETIKNGLIDDDGDGPAVPTDATPHCSCGLLDFAGIVELRIRFIIDEIYKAINTTLAYQTWVVYDYNDIRPFRVDGQTDIQSSPRSVAITIDVKDFNSGDLWHLAYTMHHEIICHAFQAPNAAIPPKNAPPTCHWTEGWVDTVAYDLVHEWATTSERPSSWLPLDGELAVGALRAIHEARYTSDKLKPDDIRRRQQAREALRALADILIECGLADPMEATAIARRFVLQVNTHDDADYKRLGDLAYKIQSTILSPAQTEAAVGIAIACLAFTRHGDLATLAAEIDQIATTGTDD